METRSKELLDKVYNHLDSIDVSKLSMSDMKDFLEVVQKGQFLETYGQIPSFCSGMFGTPFNSPAKPVETNEGTTDATKDAK